MFLKYFNLPTSTIFQFHIIFGNELLYFLHYFSYFDPRLRNTFIIFKKYVFILTDNKKALIFLGKTIFTFQKDKKNVIFNCEYCPKIYY